MFIGFDRVHERDGQTDGHRMHDGIGHAPLIQYHRAAKIRYHSFGHLVSLRSAIP